MPALHSVLPADLSVTDAQLVAGDFSARFSALERTYVYAIANRPERSALLARYACHVARLLDLHAMRTAGAQLIGTRDFRSFGSTEPGAASVRTLGRLQVESRAGLIRIEAAADGFLHHMVRAIVGTLVECGTGRRDPSEIPAILAASDRSAAGPTAPACGLYLAGVRYPDGYDSFAEPPILRVQARALT